MGAVVIGAYKKVFIAVALVGVLALVGGGLAAASGSFRSGERTSVAADEIVDGSLFIAGSTIDIAGTVDGDVFCAGQNITVSGTVRGDVICAGQNVDIEGVIEGDVRVAAQVVNVSAQVAGSATLAAQTAQLKKDSALQRDVVIGAENATLDGTIGRDVTLGADVASVGGTIGRDFDGDVVSLKLGRGADIGGNVSYVSDKNAERASGATIGGKLSRTTPEQAGREQSSGFGVAGAIYIIISLLLVSLAIVLLAPRTVHVISQQGTARLGVSALAGFATLVLLPVLAIILMISIIGLPLGLVVLLAWVVLMVISGPLAGYLLGRTILRNTSNNRVAYMAAGSLILLTLYIVPILGFVTLLVAVFVGSGMVVLELVRRLQRPRYSVKATE